MILAAIALVLLTPVTAPQQQETSGRVAKILKTGDGKTAETAYVVKSISEEYQVVAALGLPRPEMQALVFQKEKPYDVLTVTDPKTGEKIEIWFDISSFFGKGF